MTEVIWECKIGGIGRVPKGADGIMREVVERAFREIIGNNSAYCFSGWGGELTESERAVVENRKPDPQAIFDHHSNLAEQALTHILSSKVTP